MRVNERDAYNLINDGGVGEELVDIGLHSGVAHHLLHVVGVVGVDAHLCERVEASCEVVGGQHPTCGRGGPGRSAVAYPERQRWWRS